MEGTITLLGRVEFDPMSVPAPAKGQRDRAFEDNLDAARAAREETAWNQVPGAETSRAPVDRARSDEPERAAGEDTPPAPGEPPPAGERAPVAQPDQPARESAERNAERPAAPP